MPFLWSFSHAIIIMKHPPPSGLHAMRSLYVIGRDGWVWDMSITCWLDLDSSHEVGEYSVTAVCHRAGGISDRPRDEVMNKQCILYIILLLAEGTCPNRSRLGNLVTLKDFFALASVK